MDVALIASIVSSLIIVVSYIVMFVAKEKIIAPVHQTKRLFFVNV